MEPIIEYIDRHYYSDVNEDILIQKLRMCLDNGGDINFSFVLTDFDYEICILHYFVEKSYALCVEYALNRGANVSADMIWTKTRLRHYNALELAAKEWNDSYEPKSSIFDILKKRSLELYSKYNLTPLHVYCAIYMDNWSIELSEYLKTINVNASISTESPLWPGMTPILIAAKMKNIDVLSSLLDLAADPIVRDAEGNTPLHYLSKTRNCDKRLFASEASNTFSPATGESHFHLACRYCPETLDLVKRYLDQGISPDLPIQSRPENESDAGKTGLHIAAEIGCPELIRLLLEYGAAVDKKDLRGATPVDCIIFNYSSSIECMILLLIELGSNMEKVNKKVWRSLKNNLYIYSQTNIELNLSYIARLIVLKEDLVPEDLMVIYIEQSERSNAWDEAEYAGRCSEELKTLADLGLRQILDNTVVVNHKFEDKFGGLATVDFEAYPIYGQLLEMNFKRKMLELRNWKRKIMQAASQLQRMFQTKCQLPHLCAETILHYFNNEELDKFMTQQ